MLCRRLLFTASAMALARLSESPVGRCEAVSLGKDAEATLGSAMAANMLT